MSLDYASSSSSSSYVEEGEGGESCGEDRNLRIEEKSKERTSPIATRPPRRLLVDIGCGVGNALIPILESKNEEEHAELACMHACSISHTSTLLILPFTCSLLSFFPRIEAEPVK